MKARSQSVRESYHIATCSPLLSPGYGIYRRELDRHAIDDAETVSPVDILVISNNVTCQELFPRD